MSPESIETIVAALREAGTTIGAPAVEQAVLAVRIQGAVELFGVLALCLVSAFFLIKARIAALDRNGDAMVFWAGLGTLAATIATGVFFVGQTLTKLMAPIGYLVMRGAGL